MKTYRVAKCTQRLASYLVATCKPFQFDGTVIEFTVTERYIRALKADDSKFEKIEFVEV